MKEQELFEVWWNMAKHTLKCEYYDAFEIWQASANRDGYKLVPIEPLITNSKELKRQQD